MSTLGSTLAAKQTNKTTYHAPADKKQHFQADRSDDQLSQMTLVTACLYSPWSVLAGSVTRLHRTQPTHPALTPL
jgi:hypothetical protein